MPSALSRASSIIGRRSAASTRGMRGSDGSGWKGARSISSRYERMCETGLA